MSGSWGTKQAIRLSELCQEGALVPGQGGRGASHMLVLVQSHTQGLTEMPLLMPLRTEICLTPPKDSGQVWGQESKLLGRQEHLKTQSSK